MDHGHNSFAAISGDANLSKEHRPDAIFCGKGTIAMGARDAARERFGLRVPEDLSVMGFDNTSVSRFHSYALTAVKHPVRQMIESTISMMDQLIEAPQKQMERIYDMEIVVRVSVKL